ncbi:MAG: hypothetical protein IK117_08960 [Bacteroidales bacterium]|nr:hypothetical protein [Bacteroidales bacterium]
MRLIGNLILGLFVVGIVSSCSHTSVYKFNPMENMPQGDTVSLDMDLKNAVLEGIVIPSKNQTTSGFFTFSYKAEAGKQLYYKIYYQNETYKFNNSDSLNYENFYGSWEDVSIGFKPVSASGEIVDSFRIVGNPRDEQKYYGADVSKYDASIDAIKTRVQKIKNDTAWYRSIVKKAASNGYSVEKQLFLDAQWTIADDRHKTGEINHRWKRNPRTGCYSFLLVVCDENGLNSLPSYVKNIGETNGNGQFVNPIAWLETNSSKGVQLIYGSKVLKTRAVFTPKQGIFVDEVNIRTPDYSLQNIDSVCGTNADLYENALYQQFFPAVSQQYTLRNIPLVRDVVALDGYYSRNEYEQNRSRFDSSQLKYDYPAITECPCSTVKVSDDGEYISIINPGNEDAKNLKKESTGIKSRVGLTYGKYRGKIKFPVMLNQEHVWNGLTYAFWLIYQDNHSWNNRRGCHNVGYIDKGDDSPTPERMFENKYSEIDIEIVKASKFWPPQYYKDFGNHSEDASLNNEVMYSCTNWDLACQQPTKFSSGISKIPYNGEKYEAMRWNDLYKALTIKTPISNDVFKEEYYYYEIEWKPTEIIWRIGSTPETMQVVGYMNDEYTSIPNNQMLCIVTQEYHYSEWWPPIVFEQGLIPYNKSDIEGRVYEIVIE